MACSPTLRGKEGGRKGAQDWKMKRMIFIRHWRTVTRCILEVLWLLPVLWLCEPNVVEVHVHDLWVPFSSACVFGKTSIAWFELCVRLKLAFLCLSPNENGACWKYMTVYPALAWSRLKTCCCMYILFSYGPHESCAVSHKAMLSNP